MVNYPQWLIVEHLLSSNCTVLREDNLLSGFETNPDGTKFGKQRSCLRILHKYEDISKREGDNS